MASTAQHAPQQLAGRGARQRPDQLHLTRILVCGQPCPAVLHERRLGHRAAVPQHHARFGRLAAIVVGDPDEYRGETAKAYVSVRPGETVSPEELVAFCKEQMAAYKYPRSVQIVGELPKTVTGKILRRELRDAAT